MAFSTYQMQRLLARFFRQFRKPIHQPNPPDIPRGGVRVTLSPHAKEVALKAQKRWQAAQQQHQRHPQRPGLHDVLEHQTQHPRVLAEIERRAGSVLPAPYPITPTTSIPKMKQKQPTTPKTGALYHKVL